MDSAPVPSLCALSFECENFLEESAVDCMKRLAWLPVSPQIRTVELYACTGASYVQRIFDHRVTVSEAKKTPRF
jgi:hypothetical protein